MSPKVSVIIPVYNAEKYLPECLDSVCGQMLRDIEIICVNDGSTDGSAEILETYAARDERIRIISQSNAGAGAARNRGMETAEGKYLAFIDSDDFWKPELLEKTYDLAESCGADICFYPYAIYDDQTGIVSGTEYGGWFPRKQPFHPKDYRNSLFQMTAPAPGYRLYRRKMIIDHNLSYLPQHIAEDIYFVFLSMVFSEKICFITETYAFMRRGITGNLSSALWKYPRETHSSLLQIKSCLEKAGLYEIYQETFRIAAISSSEYIFWHVPVDILPVEERLQMLAELDLSDKSEIIKYRGSGSETPGSLGKIKTIQRMVKIYGLRYTARYYLQKYHPR